MFRPMLATDADLKQLQFPVIASPKLDGIRCAVVNGQALTRTLKQIPNRHLFDRLSHRHYNGLDGELIMGEPTAPDCYRSTVSAVMSRDGAPGATYWVFDLHNEPAPFLQRLRELTARTLVPRTGGVAIKLLPQTEIRDHDALLEYETLLVEQGYEGVILRRIDAPYKFGRSTAKEGYLLKLKRFEDSEAEVISILEEMKNDNEATCNELGRTQRSTAKAGLVPKGRMGKLHVRDLKTGVEFHIGTGFDDRDKTWWWSRGRTGLIIKYKFFPVGVKDLPRHPVYLGVRDKTDL